MTFYVASLAVESALEFLLSPATELIITSCHIKSTFYCTSQSDREMVGCFFPKNKITLQNDFLLIWGCLWGTHLLSFFTFPICFKCQRTVRSDQISRSVVSNFLQPHESQHARPPCPSTNSRSSLRLTSIESVMPSSHLILCRPLLLLPQSLPASESFPMSQLLLFPLFPHGHGQFFS